MKKRNLELYRNIPSSTNLLNYPEARSLLDFTSFETKEEKSSFNSFGAKFSDDICRLLFFFNKLSLEKKFILIVEKL